tara:strand:- start:16 stop:897 length:882 start_codon:yes stop_codon:yes gene_type:complete
MFKDYFYIINFFKIFIEDKLAFIFLLILLFLIIIIIFGPLFVLQNPYDLSQLNIMDSVMPPFSLSIEEKIFYLGTDDQGRDLLSAIIYGLRISLFVGLVSVAIALVIGSSLGVIGAYFGGIIDSIIMRIADLILGLPSFLIALVFLSILGRGLENVIFALVMSQWATFARVVRGSALVEKEKDYFLAAKCLVIPEKRIVFGHLLPNCLPPLIVLATINLAFAITLEASLSFLGVGLPITEPSLGLLIANGYEYIISGKYWISVYPGLFLLITVVSINVFADRLRIILNPRLNK